MKIILTILLLASVASATPMTVADYLTQQPQSPAQGSLLVSIDSVDCDCEHKAVWWPWLLPVAGVPLLFIHRGAETPPPTVVVAPTPQPTTPVPEPATWVLFGAGCLVMIIRQRRRRCPQ